MSEWVPTSERQPDPPRWGANKYLVTLSKIHPFSEGHRVSVLCYGFFDYSEKPYWFYPDPEWGDVPYNNVIAWMEIPKPYKESV